jgi:hypothetical protein
LGVDPGFGRQAPQAHGVVKNRARLDRASG